MNPNTREVFEDLTKQAMSTALEPCLCSEYMLLGLLNEAGEVAGAVKKNIRQDFGDDALNERLKGELFDVLWYFLGYCYVTNIDITELLEKGFEKLEKRKAGGNIQGDGDVR